MPDPDIVRPDPPERFAGDEAGFVLPWMAILLVVLFAFAGFGVDVWNWWLTGQKIQRAADSGALAGVVEMPDLAGATTLAMDAISDNLVETSGATVEAGDRENQLKVTIDVTVDNFFTGLLGLQNTDISRDATAEFQGRVPMGSPENKLGNDPEAGHYPQHWLSDSGRSTTKQGGDRFQSESCFEQAWNCPGSGLSNPEYDDDGYTFAVRVNETTVSQDLVIQVFDPAHVPMETQDCGENGGNEDKMPLAVDPSTITPPTADALFNVRYEDPVNGPDGDGDGVPDSKPYCVGDVGGRHGNDGKAVSGYTPSSSGVLTQTFVTRVPDNSAADDLDNPTVESTHLIDCSKQWEPWRVPAGNTYYQLLDGGDGFRDAEAALFHGEFRRWVTLCTIPASTVQGYVDAGTPDFVVQALTNVPFGSLDADGEPTNTAATKDGRNHFAIRAGLGPTLAGDVDVFANGRLPMHAAAKGANTEFFLAKVGPANAGSQLSVEFWDVGDAGVAGTLELFKDPASTGDPITCSFTRDKMDDTTDVPSSAGCTLLNVRNTTGYQGARVTAIVDIPANYTCNSATLTGCWFKIRFVYPSSGGGVSDHTVWSAGIVGDPVRLIE